MLGSSTGAGRSHRVRFQALACIVTTPCNVRDTCTCQLQAMLAFTCHVNDHPRLQLFQKRLIQLGAQ
ncbi:hypothetical protein A8H28_17195 (plasmid) [Burkholderia gladioli pv. gladioli]|nr:hypothetical protein A8H28_17195 [Burkholderia gladioli pv. gladioli]